MNDKKMTKRYGSRTSAIKSDMDKPTASMKGLDDAVSKIGAKTKQGMSDSGSFGSAFKAARSSGDKTFTWRGKSFTTNVASSKPSAPVKRAAPAAKPAAAAPKPTAAAAKPAADKPKYSAVDFKPTPKIKPAASDFSGPRIGRASALDTAKITGFPRYSASTPAKSSRPSVADVTRTDITGRKVDLSPDKKRKLQEAINRGGTRMAKGGAAKKFAKGGSIDGCAVRGKTRAR